MFAIVLLVAAATVTHLYRVYAYKFYDLTGGARWIWAQHRLSRNVPVVFYAAKEFDLPASRYYARIKIVGDPEYTLWFNGTKVGGRRMGDERRLDVYDVTPLARDKRNRIVVAVRSVNGVGGLLASVDIAPESENVVTTDGTWKIYREWHERLPVGDPPQLVSGAPMILGQPPVGRWNYLTRTSTPFALPEGEVVPPASAESFRGRLPEIRVSSGVAVMVAEPVRATAFDFGPTKGRVRLRLPMPMNAPRVVNVRLANTLGETRLVDWQVRPFVFGKGEVVLTDPDEHLFRYVVVYGGRATAEVVRSAPQ
jgi:hypothetical protein